MRPSIYEQLERDLLEARTARVAAEQWDREVAQMRRELVGFQLDLAIIRLRRALARKYRPDQPRVPAGNGRESGRFADNGPVQGAGPKNERQGSDARVVLAGGFTNDQLSLTVQDFVAQNCIGSIHREMPGEFYGSTVAEVMAEAGVGNARAKTCLKLLGRNQYRKPGRR
jgi:hypothetical protein